MTTRFKLFVMMVLEFFIWGAWLPLIFGYLPSLGFSPAEQAWILNAFPIAAIVGMFFSNQFCDRNFAAEKFLAFSHLRRRAGDARPGVHENILAVLRPDAGALPAVCADDFHRQFHRVREHEGFAEGIRPRAHGRDASAGCWPRGRSRLFWWTGTRFTRRTRTGWWPGSARCLAPV